MHKTLTLALAARGAETAAQVLNVDELSSITLNLERGHVPQRALGFFRGHLDLLACEVPGIVKLAVTVIHPAP